MMLLGPEARESIWTAADGAALPAATWEAEARPRAVLSCLHGLGGAPSDFDRLAVALAETGIHVAALTMRGQGMDPDLRRRGHHLDPQQISDDYAAFTTTVSELHPNLPVFLAGESLGALMAAHALAIRADFPNLSGAIFSAPVVALARETPPVVKSLLSFLVKLVPRLIVRPSWFVTGKRKAPQTSRDSEWTDRQKTGPQYIPAFSINLLEKVGLLIDGSMQDAAKITVPTLTLAAGRDVFVKPERVREWSAAIPSPDATFHLYPEAYHVLWNDYDRDSVIQDIASWLEQRIR